MSATKNFRFSFFNKITPQVIAIWARQLSVLMSSGVPLVSALEVLIKQEKNKIFKNILIEIAFSVRSGIALSQALSLFPELFDRFIVSSVMAAEQSGQLAFVLKTLAEGLEQKIRIKRKIQSALIYPAVIVGVSVFVVFMLFIFVIPRFEVLYQDMMPGQSLPFLTLFFIGFGHHVQVYCIFYLMALFLSVVATKVLFKMPKVKAFFDCLYMHIPFVGMMKKKLFSAQFSNSLALLLSSGVSLLNALKLAQNSFSNLYYREKLQLVCEKVQEGKALHQSLKESALFPEMLLSMIEVGEQGGRLSELMDVVSRNYNDEVQQSLSYMVALLEPVLILLMALMVGGIVLSLFLPIVRFVEFMAL